MKTPSRRGGLLGALLLGALGGCVSTPPTLGELTPTLKDERLEQAYEQVLGRFTGRAEVYNGFDTILFVAATLQTPAFRDARIHREALFRSLSDDTVQELLTQQMAESARTHEFYMGVHVFDYHFDDFDRAASIWTLRLVTPEGEVGPVGVERLGRSDSNVRAYYPYMATFWAGYRVRFPTTFPDGRAVILPSTDRVTLRLASSLGKAEVRMFAH
jgi:hypothetical protein